MAIGAYERANVVAILAAGRDPKWTPEQTAYDDAPDSAADGISLIETDVNGVLRARVELHLRKSVAFRTAVCTLNTYVNGQTWTVTIGGFAVASGVIATNWSDVVDALIAALPGVPNADALVSFARTGVGDATVLVVTGDVNANWAIVVAATGGASMDCKADPFTADLYLYGKVRGGLSTPAAVTPPDDWALIEGETHMAVTWRGFSHKLDVDGYSRLYAQVDNLTPFAGDGGTVTYALGGGLWLAGCVLESGVQT
uniref:Uncharacterized protein n=1 Tax=viral metagenome TaxID=1070528 RepID=A0A6M3M087_9ZZZZ